MINLEWLELGANVIVDISPLSNLNKLKRLSINDNYINFNAGSDALSFVESLQTKGAIVYYLPQQNYNYFKKLN